MISVEWASYTYLVNMVVYMLASNDWSHGMRFLCAALITCALELQTLLFETGFDGLGVTVVMFTVLDRDDVVCMLLGQNLTVLDGLYGRVKVILVDFTINGRCGLLMTGLGHGLVDNGGRDLLVNCGIMMTRLGPIEKKHQYRLCLKIKCCTW